MFPKLNQTAGLKLQRLKSRSADLLRAVLMVVMVAQPLLTLADPPLTPQQQRALQFAQHQAEQQRAAQSHQPGSPSGASQSAPGNGQWRVMPTASTTPRVSTVAYQSQDVLDVPPPESLQQSVRSAPVAPSQYRPPVAMSGDRRMSFNFSAAPWELVLRKYAQENDMSLQMTRTPPGTFTYFDQNRYSATEVLDLLNDHLLPAGFILVRNGRNLIVLEAKSAAIPENLVPFVTARDLDSLGRNELASVAIPIHNGVTQNAATEVQKLLSSIGRVVPLSSSQRLLVTDVGANLRRVYVLLTGGSLSTDDSPSFVYQLRNTPAEEVAKAINEFLSAKRSNVAFAQVAPPPPGQGGAITPRPAGSGFGATGAQVVAEKTTNSLLVRGSVAEVAEIRNLVTQLDRLPPQVVIQALLVEVELGDTDEFGLELGVQDSVLFDRSVIGNITTITETVTQPGGIQTSNQKIVSQTATPGFNFNNQPLGNNVSVSPGRIGAQGLTNFGTGRVNGDLGFGGLVLAAGSESISVLLRALQQKYKVDVLSRPQIRAIDNKEALIQIGRQVPVVDGVSVTAVGSANPVIRQDQSGIILRVTPKISPEGQVLIDVKAEKSAYQLTPGTGVPIFTDATNGNVIEAPVKDITTATTSVSVRTGQTIVLGGMITRDQTKVNRKVPVLSDIPLLGEAFQYKLDNSVRKELLIFLTPLVIQDDWAEEQLKQQEAERIHLPREQAEQMHGPLFGNRSLSSGYSPGATNCPNCPPGSSNLTSPSTLQPSFDPQYSPHPVPSMVSPADSYAPTQGSYPPTYSTEPYAPQSPYGVPSPSYPPNGIPQQPLMLPPSAANQTAKPSSSGIQQVSGTRSTQVGKSGVAPAAHTEPAKPESRRGIWNPFAKKPIEHRETDGPSRKR